MGCDLVRVSAYLDNELSETEREDFEAHVRECPECNEELQRMQRVTTMSIAYALPADLHARLMFRLRQEDASVRTARKPFNWRIAFVAAAVAVLVVALGVMWMRGPNQTPNLSAIASLPGGQSDDRPSSPITPLQSVTPQTTQVAQNNETFAATTALPFKLVGTVEGSTPQAILVSNDTGKQTVVGIGSEVAPGVTVKQISQGQVVFDNNGAEAILTKSAATTSTGPDLNGAWKVTLMEDQKKVDEFIALVTVNGNQVAVKTPEEPDTDQVKGSLSGLDLALSQEDSRERWDVKGTVAEDGKSMSGTVTVNELDQQVPHATYQVTAVKLDAKEILAAAQRRQRIAQIAQELHEMYPPLEACAKANDHAFPAKVDDLAPTYVSDLTPYQSTPGRNVTYHTGLALIDPGAEAFKEPDYGDTEAGMSEKMLAYEQSLRQFWGRDIPLAVTLIEVAYPEEKLLAKLSVQGSVNVIDQTAPSETPSEVTESIAAAMRASDANNLKQLGLVIKMYQNEHKFEFTPPGWLAVYPEYLTDPGVLTSPWDEEGTASYVYFFPARSQAELLAIGLEMLQDTSLAGKDLNADENMALQARVMSTVPLVADNRDIPGPETGLRNVLFLDGHVECFKKEAWDARVAPFIGR